MQPKIDFRIIIGILALMAVTFILGGSALAQVKFKTLHKFTGGKDGGEPEGSLVFDAAGNLYGTTGGVFHPTDAKVFQLSPNPDGSWTETVLYSYAGGSEPSNLRAGVIFGADGGLYGTSLSGGDGPSGTVYKLTPNSDGSWTESVLYSFTGGNDGGGPVGGLVFDAVGNLYGATTAGGTSGNGVVFELTPNSDGSWTESVLHNFNFNGKHGSYPDHGSLIFDAAGNLYGTAAGGADGYGVVFELTPDTNGSWTETVLHRFTGGNDGGSPESTLIFDQSGNLYGTTLHGGGVSSCKSYTTGCGLVFKLTPGSDGKWREQVLHRFRGGNDGSTPFSGVVFDSAGNLYGTTLIGGDGLCNDWMGTGCGTVFKLVPNSKGGWTEQVLRRFWGKPNGNPYQGVIFDSLGNLYGMTSGDGTSGFGSVFEITP